MQSYLEQCLAKLESFEGSIPWMYRDTVGKVTVGVGVMLSDAAAAVALPFRAGDQPASAAEIAADFARVNALPMGRAAHFYRRNGGLELAEEEITSLLRSVVLRFEARLRESVAGYDGFPDPAKMALLDMTYNLGPEGLLTGFPKLIQAAEAGNWKQAAAQCFRHGPGAARNQWTEAMFLSGVLPKLEGKAEGMLVRFGYGLLGLAASLVSRMRRRQ